LLRLDQQLGSTRKDRLCYGVVNQRRDNAANHHEQQQPLAPPQQPQIVARAHLSVEFFL